MTFWRLRPHLTACVAGEAIILLDLRRDRYFLVPSALTAATFEWLRSRAGTVAPPLLLDLLERSGISRAEEAPPVAQPCDVTLPVTLEEEADPRPTGLRRHIRIDALVAATWLALRLRPLARLLDQASDRAAAGTRLDPESLGVRLHAFERARRLNPLPRNCLLDSLALHSWLAQGGHASRILFGVASTPFAAHCWVQDDEAILNDHYDRVSRFSPIYAS